MRKDILYKTFCAAFMAMSLAACNDYDPVEVAYEETIDDDEVIEAPDIDPSWDLELIPNVGDHDTRVFAYKDNKYNKLFTRTLGWNGGDGVQTTVLPDGNTFWTFNDSFYGVVNADRARGNCSFPRNTIMVQTTDATGMPGETDDNLVWLVDYVQTSDPNADRYYQARTHIRHPQAEKTDEEIAAGDIDQNFLYWAGDATVVEQGGKQVLQMLWGGVDNRNGGMVRINTCLATYSLDGQPGDDTYLKLIDRNDEFHSEDGGNLQGYGDTVWEDEDGHTYLYTAENYIPIVARSTTHDLNTTWEYYIRDLSGNFQWQTTYPTAEERQRSSIMANNYTNSRPWVFKEGDWYYMVAQAPIFSRTVYIYRSELPYGPFTDQKVLFNVPYTIDKIGNQYYNNMYMVNLHQQLSREGELVFTNNTDPYSFWDNFNSPGSADYYRPWFFRVFNWEKVFEEDTDEEA